MPAVDAPPRTTRVFISHYGWEGEGRFARELADALGEYQLAVTLDQTADNSGEPLPDWIRSSIEEANVLIYVLSPGANASEWCQMELQEAKKLRKPIIPLMLRPAPRPKIIENLIYIDFRRARDLPFKKVDDVVIAIRREVRANSARAAAAIASKPNRPGIAVRTISQLAGFAQVSAWIDEAPASDGVMHLHVNLENITSIRRSFTVSVRSLTPGVRLGPTGANDRSGSIDLHFANVAHGATVATVTGLESDRAGLAELEISVASTAGPFGGWATTHGSFPISTRFR
jgi:hypothetical protein